MLVVKLVVPSQVMNLTGYGSIRSIDSSAKLGRFHTPEKQKRHLTFSLYVFGASCTHFF
jgi:hypothetical protein